MGCDADGVEPSQAERGENPWSGLSNDLLVVGNLPPVNNSRVSRLRVAYRGDGQLQHQ